MRGVVSASMLVALEDLGFADSFDVVYGCSSGAINGAYFLSGEGAWYPASIYYDDLATRKFVDMRRMLVGRPPLNLDYAFNVVVDQLKPLDYGKVIDSRIPLSIAITVVDELRTMVAADFISTQDVKDALLASAWLPLGVRGTADFRGHRAIDGGVLTALPFRLAVADGCTHILSLSTRPMPSSMRHLSVASRYAARRLDIMHPGLGHGYIEAVNQKHDDEMQLRRMRLAPHIGPPYILDLAPLPGTPEVKRHELLFNKLISAARASYEVLFAAVEHRPVSAIRSGEIRAIPRLSIAERSYEDGHIRLRDPGSGRVVSWGPRKTS